MSTAQYPQTRMRPRGVGRTTAVLAGLVGLAIGVSALPGAASTAAKVPTALPTSFSDMSTDQLWQLVNGGGDRAIVGLKDDDDAVGFLNGRSALNASERAEAEASVRSLKGVSLVAAAEVLPTVTVTVDGIEALDALRSSKHVEFVEPARFYGDALSGSGCTGYDSNPNHPGGELYSGQWGFDNAPIPGEGNYTGPYHDTWPSNELVPYNFKFSSVRKAWGRSPAGAGVTVAVIDTGKFSTQTQLTPAYAGGQFDLLQSAGRTVAVIDTAQYNGVGDDYCNHGTRSAGTVAGPRDGGGMIGVAYRANLLSVKVDNDVVIGLLDVEAQQVANGIILATNSGARVISIAMGTHIEYSSIRQAIDYAVANGRLVVAAAGTGPLCIPDGSPVMWPARLSNVMAVTALESNGQRSYDACTGPEVDNAAVVTGASAPGRHPSAVLSWGGTSAATGLVAGVAALVWSQHPNWTRQQVWDRLVWARTYPTGPINAYKAVGGLYGLSVAAPVTVAPGSTFTLTAQPQGEGPYAYQWSNGATTPQITVVAGSHGTSQTFTVNVRDTVDGRVMPFNVTVDSIGDEEPSDPICSNPRYC